MFVIAKVTPEEIGIRLAFVNQETSQNSRHYYLDIDC